MLGILILLLIVGNIFASDIDEDMRLRQQYQAPPELARLLDQAYEHNEDFRRCINTRYGICECPNNMACYIKKTYIMQRIKGREKAQLIVNEKKLNEIILPQKYLWRNFLVAEKLQPTDGRTLDGITKEQLAQLILFAQKGRFGDFIGGRALGTNNVFFTKDSPGKHFWKQDISLIENTEKKITLIDTKYFYPEKGLDQLNDLWRLFSRNSTSQCNYRTMVESDDLDWLFQPKDFESFWQKYKECFQAHSPEQT